MTIFDRLGAETSIPVSCDDDKIYDAKRLDEPPIARFTFKYRPLGEHQNLAYVLKSILKRLADILQANGIVSAPEVEDSAKDIDEPSPGEQEVASQSVLDSNCKGRSDSDS